jgi:hypothetical protein
MILHSHGFDLGFDLDLDLDFRFRLYLEVSDLYFGLISLFQIDLTLRWSFWCNFVAL